MINIRIHHFFDIIRDLGIRHDIQSDLDYGHSYHSVAAAIRDDPNLKMTLTSSADAVCMGCRYLNNGVCSDRIAKPGFKLKHNYNGYLDGRILVKLGLRVNDMVTPVELCRSAWKYINNIFEIYNLNDADHTAKRREMVRKGLEFYGQRHRFIIPFI